MSVRRIARRPMALWGSWLVLLAAPVPSAGAEIAWDEAFPTMSAPANVYFQARYRDARGDRHRLEVWREAESRLRRKTDDAIDFSVERSSAGPDLYRVVDHSRNTVVAADRAILYRAGLFVDWRGLAHVLDVPRGAYRLSAMAAPVKETVHGPCAWFRLETTLPAPAASEICWSRRWALPLIIQVPGAGDAACFQIDEVRTFWPDSATFALPHRGLLRIDAGPDEGALD